MKYSTNEKVKIILWRICFCLLLAGSCAVAVKMIVTDYTIDDAYHVIMSYRNVMGDRLFYEMWEPHQTSAFLCAALINLFIKITGQTVGVVIYLRVVGIIIHGIVAMVLFMTIRDIISTKPAALIALTYFNTFPKLSAVPEFLNMQLWFTTLFLCFLWLAYKDEFKSIVLTAVSATFLSLSIVSYPTGIILAVITLLFLCMCAGKAKARSICTFLVTCLTEAILYLLVTFKGKKLSIIFDNIKNIISGDESHQGTNLFGENALLASFKGIAALLIISALCILVIRALTYAVCALCKKKESYRVVSFGIMAAGSFIYSAFFWLIKSTGYDCPKYYYVIIPMLVCIELFSKNHGVDILTKRFCLFSIAIGTGMLLSVVLLSNVALENNVPIMGIGLFFGLVAVCSIYCRNSEFVSVILAFICVMTIGMTGYTQKVSSVGSNIFDYNAIVTNDGVAKGVVADWIVKAYHIDAEDIVSNAVVEGDKMLVIADGREVSSSGLYMIKNVEICQNSTICTPSYGENYLDYFEKFPNKVPNVIIIEKFTKDKTDNTFINRYLFEKYDFSLTYENESYLLYRRE